ncbi:MAG: phage tail assembly chaperone [Rhodospirillaceae bacterium]|nr:MAG: phage tail assembly chaperone [Rhodospirillaceae bacterium]
MDRAARCGRRPAGGCDDRVNRAAEHGLVPVPVGVLHAGLRRRGAGAGKKSGEDRELDLFEAWQIGIIDLHLEPEFFWSLTPREFYALVERNHRERYRLSAHVCAFLAEVWRDREQRSEPFSIDDFLPSLTPTQEELPADAMAFPRAMLLLMATEHGIDDRTKGVTIEYK